MPQLVKIGNSQGVRIPKPLVQQAKWAGTELEFVVVEEGLLITPMREKPRQGWEARVKAALAAHADEGIDEEWLGAPLTDDEDWEVVDTTGVVDMKRFEVWLVGLDPAIGREIKKTRPCVIISPDELSPLSTVIVAPLTSKGFAFPGRIKTEFQNKQGLILLDQMRAVDKKRLYKKLGDIDVGTVGALCETLREFFAC